MEIVIEEVNQGNVGHVGKCDGEFVIDSRLILHVENNEIRYTIAGVPRSKKQYGEDDIDYTTYIDDPEKTIFLAYTDGQIAGQIILRKSWNNYAHIEDIAVDVRFRRIGIGRALILRAKKWAQDRGLPGIMLETQDNNVGACKFYEGCGFRLSGFDTYLYKGLNRSTDEIALYWYLVFDPGSASQLTGGNAASPR